MNALLRILSLPAQLLAKVPGLGPFVKVLSTTVGQKILMAITGLSLCGFLVAHLGGNLKLYAGGQAFNDYAYALHSLGPILAAAEVGLFATFALHIGLAISTAAMNKIARRKEYAIRETKQGMFILPGGGASNWMLLTGLLILVFLVTHILDMKLKANPGVDYSAVMDEKNQIDSEFHDVKAVLSTSLNAAIYMVGFVALGIHLSHGVRSALQTLGINHSRWNLLLKICGILFAWGVAIGFMSLVVWAMSSKS